MPTKLVPIDINERLRSAIEAKGMKHSWVAEEADITPATLSNILRGRVSQPSFSSVLAIARAIGEPLGALLGERSDSLLESEQEVLRQAIEILERRVLRPAPAKETAAEADALPRHEIPAAIERLGARLAFRVIGDSLADEGIRAGNILFVRPTTAVRAANGRLVVCRIDDALVVRKLIATGRGVRLVAGSSHLTVPDVSRLEVLGVVVAHLGEL